MSSADFDAIAHKIIRAREHLKVFEEESIVYFKQCEPTFDIKADLKARSMRVQLTIKKEPPVRLGILVGDCVHNARTALDNIICALVRLNKPTSTCSGRQFPTTTDPDQYKATRNELLRDVPEDAKLLIDLMHPCSRVDVGIPATMHAVAILNTLSNRDKHRVPHLVYAYSRNTKLIVAPPSSGRLRITVNGPLYSDIETEIPFVTEFVQYHDRLQVDGSFYIAFKDRSLFGDEPVPDLVDFCLNFVENVVLSGLKPFFS